MKKLALPLVLGFSLICTGCNFAVSGWKTVAGSGQVIRETREVADFDRVHLRGSGQLEIVQGTVERLTIEADDNLLPLIESQVSNGELSVGPRHVNLRPSQTIQYRLELQELKELQLSGSLKARADSLETPELAVQISGSGSIALPKLQADDLKVKVSGSGNAELAGQVEHASLGISGSGNFKAGDLECQRADVRISGSGDATVWVHQSLDVGVSGSGEIRYYGTPAVDQSVSGSGRVRGLGPKEKIERTARLPVSRSTESEE